MAKISQQISRKLKRKSKGILKRWLKGALLLIVGAIGGSFLYPFSATNLDEGQYKVISIADGDTVKVLDAKNEKITIRLAYIDAPELKQPFGQKSKQHLGSLLFKKTVSLERVNKDQYGRLVARIWLDGQDVNLNMVQNGLAWHYQAYAKKQKDYALYAKAQWSAKQNKKGLWQDRMPIEPWNFRKTERNNKNN